MRGTLRYWTARIALRIVVLAIIISVVELLIPGWQIHGGPLARLWVAAVLAAVNTVLGPVFRLIGNTFFAAGYGLFLIVVNGLMALIAAELTSHLVVQGFWWALLAGFLVGVLSWAAEFALPIGSKSRKKGK